MRSGLNCRNSFLISSVRFSFSVLEVCPFYLFHMTNSFIPKTHNFAAAFSSECDILHLPVGRVDNHSLCADQLVGFWIKLP